VRLSYNVARIAPRRGQGGRTKQGQRIAGKLICALPPVVPDRQQAIFNIELGHIR
jgi:hypothetical protein